MTFAYCRTSTHTSIFDWHILALDLGALIVYPSQVSRFFYYRKGKRFTVENKNDVQLGLVARVRVSHTNYKRSTVPRSTYNIQKYKDKVTKDI
jgi:hypothetical protein